MTLDKSINNHRYQKKSNKYKYVYKVLDAKGNILWSVILYGKTTDFEDERQAAIFVDKELIKRKKDPVNIFVRKEKNFK